jgi:hypothetical protein
LAADNTAAEEHAHAGVLENWVPAFMVEKEPGSESAAEEHDHAGAGDEGWATAFDDEDPAAVVVKDASGFRRAGERMVNWSRLPLAVIGRDGASTRLSRSQQQVLGSNLGTTR